MCSAVSLKELKGNLILGVGNICNLEVELNFGYFTHKVCIFELYAC